MKNYQHAVTGAWIAALLVLFSPDVQAEEACGQLTFYTGPERRLVQYIDLCKKDLSAGNLRIGYQTLTGVDGKKITDSRWMVRSFGKGLSYTTVYIETPDGRFYVETLFGAARPHDDDARSNIDRRAQGIVKGGTGVFKGAKGTFVTSLDGDLYKTEADIECG